MLVTYRANDQSEEKFLSTFKKLHAPAKKTKDTTSTASTPTPSVLADVPLPTPPPVVLADLFSHGLMSPGEGVLSVKYKGETVLGDLLPDGALFLQKSKQVFRSVSGFCVAAKRLVKPNLASSNSAGWKSLRYKGKPLLRLKTELQQRIVQRVLAKKTPHFLGSSAKPTKSKPRSITKKRKKTPKKEDHDKFEIYADSDDDMPITQAYQKWCHRLRRRDRLQQWRHARRRKTRALKKLKMAKKANDSRSNKSIAKAPSSSAHTHTPLSKHRKADKAAHSRSTGKKHKRSVKRKDRSTTRSGAEKRRRSATKRPKSTPSHNSKTDAKHARRSPKQVTPVNTLSTATANHKPAHADVPIQAWATNTGATQSAHAPSTHTPPSSSPRPNPEPLARRLFHSNTEVVDLVS